MREVVFYSVKEQTEAKIGEKKHSREEEKSETELTASVLKKRKKKTKDTEGIKRTLFNWTKQGKTCKFSRKSSFLSLSLIHI